MIKFGISKGEIVSGIIQLVGAIALSAAGAAVATMIDKKGEPAAIEAEGTDSTDDSTEVEE